MSDFELPKVPRWVRYLLIPGFVGPMLILGFIFITELAHDEARCPYSEASLRQVSEGVVVREDRRSCLWNVEERRFTVVRGAQEHTLGRRRFRAEAFAPAKYHWSAQLRSPEEVQVDVHNAGHDDASFREGTKAERGM